MNVKNYSGYLLLSASALLFLLACTERTNISTEASPPRLVVYGYITTDTTQHAIRITRSTGYFATAKPEGISHAAVTISYDGGTMDLNESPEDPGLYLTSPDVYGIPGKTYTLHAFIDFNGDGQPEEYEASSYLPFPAILDSAAITPSPIMDKFLQVIIWGNLPEESSNNFSFHIFRNGIVMNDSLRGYNIVKDDYLNTKIITALPVFQLNQDRDKYKLSPGDTVTVQIESLTSEYATFMENAQQELQGSIPLFGGPPANVETNIRSLSPDSKIEISGFFTAYSKSKTSTVY